jgi:adenine-specific DNA-methyltransferase
MTDILHTEKEQHRLGVQAALDAEKTQLERNRMGQFATPSPLAFEVLSYAKKLMPRHEKIRFLDPALGTGAFYSALLQAFPASRIAEAVGYEIDPHYGTPAQEIWSETGLHVELLDFTKAAPPETKFNLLICNPPYVRHHHIVNGNKARIQAASGKACGIQFGGLAGLYCHFLGLSHAWMSAGGIAGWLIPSEFMDVNYGDAVKRYLLEKVTLLHIHRFDPHDVQFNDALVSSAIVWFRNEAPPEHHAVEFSFGGSLAAPKVSRMISVDVLRSEAKWTRFPLADSRSAERGFPLKDFFAIRRGLATGDNDFFILSADEIAAHKLPLKFFKPILPSPRYLPVTEVMADDSGNPLIETPLFLLDCRLPEAEIEKHYPSLWHYLQDGVAQGVADRYLCKHRTPWYSQENRPAAPFVCTYLGRGNVKSGRPFRFILNNSKATVTNVYLALYPKDALAQAMAENPSLARRVWTALNEICPESMMAEGRVYGGGLHKLEPKELANVPADALAALLAEHAAEQETSVLAKRA